jgi:hypothetical protein
VFTIQPKALDTTEWTSVKEELPTPHTDCLVITDTGVITTRKFCVHKFAKGVTEVIYWIALPEVLLLDSSSRGFDVE